MSDKMGALEFYNKQELESIASSPKLPQYMEFLKGQMNYWDGINDILHSMKRMEKGLFNEGEHLKGPMSDEESIENFLHFVGDGVVEHLSIGYGSLYSELEGLVKASNNELFFFEDEDQKTGKQVFDTEKHTIPENYEKLLYYHSEEDNEPSEIGHLYYSSKNNISKGFDFIESALVRGAADKNIQVGAEALYTIKEIKEFLGIDTFRALQR